MALRDRIESLRWKQVVERAPGQWMHHLEVTGWLREAAESAGQAWG